MGYDSWEVMDEGPNSFSGLKDEIHLDDEEPEEKKKLINQTKNLSWIELLILAIPS